MTRVLITVGHYLPGYQAGGPVRSIANLVEQLGDEFEFYIVTRDREFGSTQPYSNIKVNQWQPVGKAQVRYLSPMASNVWNWQAIFRSVDYDTLYLNSFFARWTLLGLVLKRARWLTPRKVVLAPRGEFSSGAIKFKSQRKRGYLRLQNRLGLCRSVVWHATSDSEVEDIRREVPPASWQNTTIHVADNLVALPKQVQGLAFTRCKQQGELRVVFLSRVAPKKNLDFALSSLRNVHGSVQFDIYGPIEDRAYWETCLKIMATMPQNVCVEYKGAVLPDEVAQVLSQSHLFLLPTQGENFGHAIYEALATGCPLLISDQTPWRDLQAHQVGWDLPLEDPAAFSAAMNECVAWDQMQFDNFSRGANQYADEFVNLQSAALKNYRAMFRAD
ncbi:MAG: glycosyltransferase [Chloroflexi bacterium]|nr:glycosyltransferase [Chloroflexota bacterium]